MPNYACDDFKITEETHEQTSSKKRQELKRIKSGATLMSHELEEKINELDSMFKAQSMTNLHEKPSLRLSTTIKEQILAKCMRNTSKNQD